jgi:hypothetical protein
VGEGKPELDRDPRTERNSKLTSYQDFPEGRSDAP